MSLPWSARADHQPSMPMTAGSMVVLQTRSLKLCVPPPRTAVMSVQNVNAYDMQVNVTLVRNMYRVVDDFH